MSRPLVFLDTETTSLQPWREAWEIAMIRRDDKGRRELSFFISRVDLSHADPASLKFSRFYERHPDFDGPKAKDIWLEQELPNASEPVKMDIGVAARIVHDWTRDAVIVGAVPNFDIDMLHRDMLREKLQPAWHYHLVDVENLAVGWLSATPRAEIAVLEPPWESDALSKACGVEPPADEERHTALGDALWVERWYDWIMGIES